jgi:hypothetical protein
MSERDGERSEPGSESDDAGAPEWLKNALGDGKPAPGVDVLAGVQRKLRERSGGKFYADLWSTARQPPTLTFLVTGALMLVVVALTYAVLAPLRGKPERVPTEPAPVEILAPPTR